MQSVLHSSLDVKYQWRGVHSAHSHKFLSWSILTPGWFSSIRFWGESYQSTPWQIPKKFRVSQDIYYKASDLLHVKYSYGNAQKRTMLKDCQAGHYMRWCRVCLCLEGYNWYKLVSWLSTKFVQKHQIENTSQFTIWLLNCRSKISYQRWSRNTSLFNNFASNAYKHLLCESCFQTFHFSLWVQGEMTLDPKFIWLLKPPLLPKISQKQNKTKQKLDPGDPILEIIENRN